jgi:ribosomal-protein-alanine N-acetyltransferase
VSAINPCSASRIGLFIVLTSLQTSRLSLRPLQMADFADFFEYAQDPAVSGPGMWRPYVSETVAREDFEHILSLYRQGLMWWALEDRLTRKMIGRCELAAYDPIDARAELSYALNSLFWGQGLMTEAARAVLRYGFEEMRLNRVSAKVFVDNAASVRLLEKLGMVREGRLRQYVQVRGQPEDVDIYSVLHAEWKP